MFDCLVRHIPNKIFEPKPTVYKVATKIVYFCLAFTGLHSLQTRYQITQHCNAAYPHLNIRFVFCSTTHTSSFFPFKDTVPKFMRSGVVHLFLSADTVPHRFGSNHAPFTHQSIRTLGNLSYNRKTVIQSSQVWSSILSYLNSTGHSANFDDFEILSSCSDTCELK